MNDTVKHIRYILLGDRCHDFLKAHHDIGLTDACRIMDIYLSTFRRMTNMTQKREWPFQMLRSGIETAELSWESIKRHREEMMEVRYPRCTRLHSLTHVSTGSVLRQHQGSPASRRAPRVAAAEAVREPRRLVQRGDARGATADVPAEPACRREAKAGRCSGLA